MRRRRRHFGGSAVAAPAAPTALTATQISTSRADLAWTDNATTETEYRVYRSTDGVTYSLLATIAASSTSYSDTTVTGGATYYYKVAAYNSSGEALSSAVSVIIYLLNDDFTSSDGTGTRSRTMQPGPGAWAITDTNLVSSIAADKFSVATGGVGAVNPNIISATLARSSGRVLILRGASASVARSRIGWYKAANAEVFALEILQHLIYDGALSVSVPNTSFWSGINDDFALVLKATGADLYVKFGGVGSWRLIWVGRLDSTASLFVQGFEVNTTALWSFDAIRGRDLPAPFVAVEGIAVVNVATPLTGVVQTATADMITDFEFTLPASPSAGDRMDLRYNITDASNYNVAYVKRNAGNTAWDFLMDKVVAGTPTTLVAAVTNVGAVDMIRVNHQGSVHNFFTKVTTQWSKRGAEITDANQATATGIAAVFTVGASISLKSYAGNRSIYDTELNKA